MSIDDLYELAEQKGYEVLSFPLPKTQSVTVQTDPGKCFIGLDYSLRGIAELEALAHECGHCETGTFYSADTDETIRRKCEYKANRWAYEHLVPLEDLLSAYQSGCRSVWELADYFGVSCETMAKILEAYSTQKGY